MSGIFGRVIAVVLLIILIVIVPVGFMIVKTERAEDRYAKEILEAFAEEVMQDGEITVEEWEKLISDLERNGVLYDIEINVGKSHKWYTEE